MKKKSNLKKSTLNRLTAVLIAVVMVMTGTMSVWADSDSAKRNDDGWNQSPCYLLSASVQKVTDDGDIRVECQVGGYHNSDDSSVPGHTSDKQLIIVSFDYPVSPEILEKATLVCPESIGDIEYSNDFTKIRFPVNRHVEPNEYYHLDFNFSFNKALSDEDAQQAATEFYNAASGSVVVYDGSGTLWETYSVIVEQTPGGILTADTETASEGEFVTVTAEPDEGMMLKNIFVNDGNVEVTTNTDGTYSFEMPAEHVTVRAVWEEVAVEPVPEFKTVALNVGAEIGVMFYMNLPESDRIDYENSYMEFNVENGNQTQVPFANSTLHDNGIYRGFSGKVNALQMANAITAIYHYTLDREEKTVVTEYSVEQYLIDARGKYGDSLDRLLQNMYDYGYYSLKYLSEAGGWTIGDTYKALTLDTPTEYYEDDIEAVKAAVADMGATCSKCSDIKRITLSLMLDSATSIILKFEPAADYTGSLVAKIDGKKVSAKKQNDGKYKVTIPNIKAAELGTAHEVTVETDNGICTVGNLSPMSFVNLNLNLEKMDENRDKEMVALYRYMKAARAYKYDEPYEEQDEPDEPDYWSASNCCTAEYQKTDSALEDGILRYSFEARGHHHSAVAGNRHTCDRQYWIFTFNQPLPEGAIVYVDSDYVTQSTAELSADRMQARVIFDKYMHTNADVYIDAFTLSVEGLPDEMLADAEAALEVENIYLNDLPFRYNL